MTAVAASPDRASTFAAFLAARGDIGREILRKDWSQTSLGPMERWPESLRATLRFVLTTRQPIVFFWGPDLLQFFNESYAPIIEGMPPDPVGAPFLVYWGEVFEGVRPYFERAMAGEGTWESDLHLRLTRNGVTEDTYWTFSYSPLYDDDGAIVGFLNVVTETTRAVSTRQALAEANRVLGEEHVKAATAQEALDAEREQLAQMFEQAPTFMAILRGPDFRIERVNPGYVRLVDGRDVVGKTVAEALPDAVAQGYLELLRSVYASGLAFEATGYKYAVQAEAGGPVNERYVDFVYQPLRDEAGGVTGIFVEGVDVTERTRMRLALRDSEERYSALLATIDVGFCIIEMKFDADDVPVDYRILEANPAFVRQTGLVDAIGRWVSEVAPGLERHWFEAYGRVARTGEPVHFENGAQIFGRWYDVRALRVGAAGEGRVAILFSDISERRRQEAELAELNATLEERVEERTRERDRLWQLSRDPFLVADVDGRWLQVSRAWTDILGWSQEELLGRTSEWMEHPDDRSRTREEIDDLAAGHETTTFQNRFRAKDGSYRWFSWTAVPHEGLLYCVARDITAAREQTEALRLTEEQLRQSQKMEVVGQLTGGVAHDFNNLLTVVKSSASLLKRPNLSEERRARYIDAISDTVDRAVRLTAQLLAFARRQALKPEVFDVGQGVRMLGDMMGTLTGSRIAVETRLPDASCFVDADPNQFDTALVNMAVNARDAMDGQGRLTIAVREADAIPAIRAHPAVPGAFVAVSMTDTGAGIPAEQIDRIFEPFFTTKEVGRGTGLGLSQVFGFAKQSGGEIVVESAVGHGTTFTLYLPQVRGTAAPKQAPAPLSPEEGGGARVLVVEDNPDVGRFVLQSLDELGYAPHLVESAEAALATLAADPRRHEVVFSDVVMPGMNGVELGRRIRSLHPTLPVVLTSGYAHVLSQDQNHGFALLQKPYSVEDLSRALRTALGGRR